MTISFLAKDTATDVDDVIPAVWRLHGNTPAL
eukprot:CAMPEP_0169212822 /NCGR_PEP_ID=MMETSP1016-20121227/16481_1 /TAXON_ID=342587 /ORGANISM="Karlodinium micrum, Strain CCMP2283" /LENGTH=31 /DNA_ID= /DNA_START= /DNA_END= /DNA_ORIENTATION=